MHGPLCGAASPPPFVKGGISIARCQFRTQDAVPAEAGRFARAAASKARDLALSAPGIEHDAERHGGVCHGDVETMEVPLASRSLLARSLHRVGRPVPARTR